MSTEHKYPRTATTDIGTKYRVTYPGAIPEFHHDNGTWMNSEDYMTERMLFDDPRAHETTAKPPAPALDPLTADVIVKAREAVESLKISDAYLGWGDCSLENVHNRVRATIASLTSSLAAFAAGKGGST